MSTINNLIERVLLNLEGYMETSGNIGILSGNINDTQTNFTVNAGFESNTEGIQYSNPKWASGIIEIDSELIFAPSFIIDEGFNYTSAIRGFRGSEKTEHLDGTMVRYNPKYPKSAILSAINYTIKSLYPRLIAPAKIEFTGITSRVQYDMPDNALNVLSVQWLPTTASRQWAPVKQWSFDSFAGSNASGTKVINLSAPANGRKIQVVYAAEPNTVAITDDFSDSGLPDWMEELIVIGACWRLTSFIDANRVWQTTAEQALINSSGLPINSGGSATSLSKYYLNVFENQMQSAMQRQSKELPTTKHKLI